MHDRPPLPPRASTGRPAVLSWLRMARFTQQVTRAWTQALRTHDLSPAQFDVIASVGGQPDITQRELSHKLLVTDGNISQLLTSLTRRELIDRTTVGKEKRLSLTPAGQQLFDRLIPHHEDWLEEQFQALTFEEQQQLSQLLRVLLRSRH
ncbi:MarR family winged helix-turn-helix transcriptional regulator [Deinococcus cellulosilyticus]|uniref:MarR family transcriptional regulator n=1 Tax=Deinococcus cellulosilyticus (strain DSM 18568 / NBRC 106333 / KACC 11606 / 5516J-15) TaxID=1223518 RepID=A0A511N7A8_DEIC1|nr:MarR family transcriptional regulator [Deinococcus cellulosilyticus]GEM48377.1 MarR family transcriptional regulator [Deinococcus cellulosilyticus NBRC 106333 = KACC 11606]